MFTELYREEKREEGDRSGQEDKGGESKVARQIQPVISSLSVLHRLEHTKRFTELGREEKGEEGDTVTWWRKRRVQKGREPASQESLPYVLSTVWIPQRCSQIYTEKKRRRKETEVARRIKGGIKRRETDPASNHFPKCSPQPGTNKEIHRVG